MNYYNEHDPKAAAWLRALIAKDCIAAGHVDERGIQDVRPADLAGYRQCHFFAGIGGWSLALRLAGVPDDEEIWTMSCPCQPFSVAGQGLGAADERHLWPDARNLVGQRRPAIVFGEQVASKDGRVWLAGVSADLEAAGYRFAAANLCAAGVSAPHVRQRLYWVADASLQYGSVEGQTASERGRSGADAGSGLAHSRRGRRPTRTSKKETSPSTVQLRQPSEDDGVAVRLGSPNRTGRQKRDAAPVTEESRLNPGPDSNVGLGNTNCDGQQSGCEASPSDGHRRPVNSAGGPDRVGMVDANGCHGHWWSGPLQVGWNCVEGEVERGGRKYRAQWRTKPGLSLLADGIPGRVAQLRGFGNAIVPPQAAEFIQAYFEALNHL